MATWGAHIRIAEAILNTYSNLHEEAFLVGNVGPDCGEPNEDWSRFSPPKSVSHWIDENKVIKAEVFYETYLSNTIEDIHVYSFLLGYYVHLLTDIEWNKLYKEKIEFDPKYSELKSNPNFIWTIKEDWYDLDHLYFMKNRDSIFHRVFKHIESFPDYLDYYPIGGIERRLKYISNLYSGYKGNPVREYTFLQEDEMNSFVRDKSYVIIGALKQK